MNVTRRTLMRLLGVSPLVAKQLEDEKVLRLSSSTVPLTPITYSQGNGSADVDFATNKAAQLKSIANYFQQFGVPDWVEEEIRTQCNYVAALDPDLAAKRSWSMSVKIAEQRERNYRRRIAAIGQGARYNLGRSVWQKFTGKVMEFW